MKKKYKQNALQTKIILVVLLSLLTVCTYQITKIATAIDELSNKVDLFEIIDRVVNYD
jgi:hypothetical protein